MIMWCLTKQLLIFYIYFHSSINYEQQMAYLGIFWVLGLLCMIKSNSLLDKQGIYLKCNSKM